MIKIGVPIVSSLICNQFSYFSGVSTNNNPKNVNDNQVNVGASTSSGGFGGSRSITKEGGKKNKSNQGNRILNSKGLNIELAIISFLSSTGKGLFSTFDQIKIKPLEKPYPTNLKNTVKPATRPASPNVSDSSSKVCKTKKSKKINILVSSDSSSDDGENVSKRKTTTTKPKKKPAPTSSSSSSASSTASSRAVTPDSKSRSCSRKRRQSNSLSPEKKRKEKKKKDNEAAPSNVVTLETLQASNAALLNQMKEMIESLKNDKKKD